MIEQFFFDAIRGGFTGALDQAEVDGTKAIFAAMRGEPLAWTAYALATAWHETGGTMRPVTECGGERYFFARYDPCGARPDIARRLGNTQAGDGARFCGRGYVQLTGRANYARAERELGVPLLAQPERALDPDVAAAVLRDGMREGWFTGVRFDAFLPSAGQASRGQFVAARRIVNGQDRADDIALYALGYQRALGGAGWTLKAA